jgi:acetyl esterase/lipase
MTSTRAPIDPTMNQILKFAPMPSIAELGHEPVRKLLLQAQAQMPPGPAVAKVEDRTIDGGIGVRIYTPAPDATGQPIMVFYHGGGFVIGDLDSHDSMARAIAAQVGAVVVAVDYRLAPEHPFPAAVDDAFTALEWVSEHAAELGGDPDRLAVGGDSAGGNLSAVVALLARDAGGPPVKFQMLWYPVTEWGADLPSITENAHAPILTVADMARFREYYLGEQDPTTLGIKLSPASAADLSGLPPAYIATAGYDPLRDDGARYAELLRAAGVPAELDEAESLVHGYVMFATIVPAAGEAFQRSLAALKAAL